eukprot:TRINITY_DN13119_c0_g1_i4.p1 TRINITY_DN13119_c0_g1~~TRINITY_DN13119_c0_g1_i4.p1  ORF type:complete len:245 (+),score=70.52 TRINITY_DN13119_c0_g1_i4:65-799(+)
MCIRDRRRVHGDERLISNETTADIEVNNDSSEGIAIVKLKKLADKKGIFRVYADVLDAQRFNATHLRVYIISSEELGLVEIPRVQGDGAPDPKYWDLGFFNAPFHQFIEINALTSSQIRRDSNLNEYQDLIKFIKNSKSVDLKTFFGFNSKDAVEANGDLLLPKEKILNSLDKYGYEHKNVDHILASAQDGKGLYSFRKIEKKFLKVNINVDFIETRTREESDDDEYLEQSRMQRCLSIPSNNN